MAYGDELLRHVAGILDQVVARMTTFAAQIPGGQGGSGGQGGPPHGGEPSQQPDHFPGFDRLIEAAHKFEQAVITFQDMSGRERTGMRVIVERIEQDAISQLEAMIGKIAGRNFGAAVPVPVSGSPPPGQFGQVFGQATKSAGTTLGAMGNQNSLSGMSSVLKGIGQLAEMIPGIGTAVGAVTKFGAGLLESVDTVKRWNDSLLQGNFAFAQFSASMTGVQIEKEFRDIRRSQQQGERRAGSTRDLMRAQANLQDELAPLQDAWNNGMADFQTFITDYLASPLAKILRIALQYEKEEKETGDPFGSPVVGEWMGRGTPHQNFPTTRTPAEAEALARKLEERRRNRLPRWFPF